MCWFEVGHDPVRGARPVPGLGLLPGGPGALPGEPARRLALSRGDPGSRRPAGWGVNDGGPALFVGRELAEAVSSTANAVRTVEEQGLVGGDACQAPAAARGEELSRPRRLIAEA